MSKLYDVIIAGAGPIGLSLACELGLAQASVLVLERDPDPESLWKVHPLGRRGLNTLSVEHFYRRGLLGELFDLNGRPMAPQKKPGFQFGGHFAGIMFDANKFELDRFKYRLAGPALMPSPTTIDRIEKTLTEYAESLGVTILRGKGFSKIVDHNEDGVTIEAGENDSYRCRWLVGCDGGRSGIRKAAGFDFVGTEAKFTGYAVQCEWDHFEKLKPGFHLTKNGLYIISGPNALFMTDFDDGTFDRTQEITQERVQTVFNRISGIEDVKISKVHIASSFTDRAKQATSYRKGRILLAGDAAHIHGPVGSQGLNLGLGDAMNLGWKLGATIRRERDADGKSADLALLDTYESERHPIGAWVLEYTRAQVAMMQPGLYGAALQTLIRDLIDTTDGANLFIDRQWGLSQRYQLGKGEAYTHPLVGSSAPDFEFEDGSRLGDKLREGGGLLVDFQHETCLERLISGEKHGTRVEYVSMKVKEDCDMRALLVRPDGIVAWVTEKGVEADLEAAEEAIQKWFVPLYQ